MTYSMPLTLQELLPLAQRPDAQIVAGGTDWFATLHKGADVGHLVDVTRVAEMQGISRRQTGWRIGGAVTWGEVVRADLPAAFAGLQAAAAEVGSVQIQNAGTVAGNLCNASPAADGVPALLALDAQVELSSAQATRRMALSAFITGVRKTQLRCGEIVTALHIDDVADHAVGYFEKLGSRRYLVISITMVAGVIGVDADGRIDLARIAVGACSPVAQRQPRLEAALIGAKAAEVVVTPADLDGLAPIDDIRADAPFRLAAAAEQCTRILQRTVT